MSFLRFLLVLSALFAVSCTAARADDGSGPRRIVYWEKWTGFEGEAMGRVVDAFNERERLRAKREPGYRPIEVEMVTVSKIEQKLLVAIAGGNPPDVAGAYGFSVPAYAEKGALTDVSEKLEQAGLGEAHFIPAYRKLGAHRGRIWAVPTTPATIALHWNQRMFREVGLDPNVPPRTIEELDAMAEKLTRWEVTLDDGRREIRSGYLPEVLPEKKRLLQVGFLPSEPGWWSWAWGHFFGGDLVRGDRITAGSAENVRAYEWIASYSKKLGVQQIQRFRSGFGSFSSPQNPFLSGKVAMVLQGVWMANFIEKYSPGMQWSAAPFPPPADRPDLAGATVVDADVLVIPKDSKYPQEAFAFMAYVSSAEAMESLCLGQKKHSPLSSSTADFKRRHPHPYLELFQSLSYSKAAFSTPRLAGYNEYMRELSSAIDAIQNLSATPAVALGSVQVRMQHAYDRDNRAFERRGGM